MILLVDTAPYIINDKDSEKTHKFKLSESLEKASQQSMLTGYKICTTKSVKPEPAQMKGLLYFLFKLNSNLPFFLCLNTPFVFTNYQPREIKPSYNRALMVDWSLSGIMTSILIICESESPWPATSSILISRMVSSSAIIPYRDIKNDIKPFVAK